MTGANGSPPLGGATAVTGTCVISLVVGGDDIAALDHSAEPDADARGVFVVLCVDGMAPKLKYKGEKTPC